MWGSVVTPIVDEPRPRRAQGNREIDVYTALAILASVVFTVFQFCNVGDDLYRGTPAHTVLESFDAAVPFLFVLIGYRVYRPIVVAYLDPGPALSPRSFLTRQAVAVLPAYYVVVTVVWFCRQHSLPGDWHDLVEHLTFTQVFDSKRIFYTDGPAWAVSVTVFFLLLLAIVEFRLSRSVPAPTRKQRLVTLALPTAALAVVSLTWKAWSLVGVHRSTAGSSTTWYGPLANLDNFAAGMAIALALVVVQAKTVRPQYRFALRAAGSVVLCAAVATRQDDTWSAAYFTTICSVGFAALITAAVLAADAKIDAGPGRFDSSLTWVGRFVVIAYGTYLWREPVLLTLNGWDGAVVQRPDAFVQDTVVVLAVSVFIGWLSYLAVEQPALQLYRLATRGRWEEDAPIPARLASIHPIDPARAAATSGGDPD